MSLALASVRCASVESLELTSGQPYDCRTDAMFLMHLEKNDNRGVCELHKEEEGIKEVKMISAMRPIRLVERNVSVFLTHLEECCPRPHPPRVVCESPPFL